MRRTLKRNDPDGSIEEAKEKQFSDGEKSTAYLSIHSLKYLLHVDVLYVCVCAFTLVSEKGTVCASIRGAQALLMRLCMCV